jgi:hypothetical protein
MVINILRMLKSKDITWYHMVKLYMISRCYMLLCHVISSVLETCRVLNFPFLGRSPIWKSGSRTSTQKRGDSTGSHKGEPRAQTDQPDPQLIKHKRDEILWIFMNNTFLCLDDFRCGHQKTLNKLDQTCRDPYLISNKYQNVLELLGN